MPFTRAHRRQLSLTATTYLVLGPTIADRPRYCVLHLQPIDHLLDTLQLRWSALHSIVIIILW